MILRNQQQKDSLVSHTKHLNQYLALLPDGYMKLLISAYVRTVLKAQQGIRMDFYFTPDHPCHMTIPPLMSKTNILKRNPKQY